MASVKKLKDEINYITYDLIARTNHPEGIGERKKLKTHYRRIRLDLGKMMKLADGLSKKD